MGEFMISTALFRRILWAAAVFNVLGAFMLGFPASAAGQFAGLPAEVPLAYRAIVAAFVLEFGGAYAWLALQPEPDRPLVVLGGIGKAVVVLLVVALWATGLASDASLAMVTGDLIFAVMFALWLRGTKPAA
jgi:hypothetical protein